MSNTKMIGARIKPDLEESIRAAAAGERRTVSDWIRCRLEDAVAGGKRAAADQRPEAA